MASNAYVNRIATAVPEYEVNQFYLHFAARMLNGDEHRTALFHRVAQASGIERRYSCYAPASFPDDGVIDQRGNFKRGNFPGTELRMQAYEESAAPLACRAVEKLLAGEDRSRVTHIIVTSCTGFYAPGVDLDIVERCGLSPSVERTIIGFMGCYAAVNALKLAHHIVRADAAARVLVVSVELCTLHINETQELEELLSFCLWGDGCAAALVTAEPQGLRLDGFKVLVDRDSRELMSWRIGDFGFDMVLSGRVPAAIYGMLRKRGDEVLGNGGPEAIDLWAIHPGGRSILDIVQRGLKLEPEALTASREVLRLYGNMSSATILFVLERLLGEAAGQRGCAMAFGPGLTAETLTFTTA